MNAGPQPLPDAATREDVPRASAVDTPPTGVAAAVEDAVGASRLAAPPDSRTLLADESASVARLRRPRRDVAGDEGGTATPVWA